MRMSKMILAFAVVVLLAGTALAQGTTVLPQPSGVEDSTYLVNYFSLNIGPPAPDGWVRISNTGFRATGNNTGPANGNICANIYVFDAFEEMVACCSCNTTPDGLRFLDVFSTLTYYPLQYPAKPINGVIKILGSYNAGNGASACDARTSPGTGTITNGLRAWGTHVQYPVTVGANTVYAQTETEFASAPLSTQELVNLSATCAYTQQLGTGAGICGCGGGE